MEYQQYKRPKGLPIAQLDHIQLKDTNYSDQG